MKLTHKQKIKLARRMRSRADVAGHIPIFETEAWTNRKNAKAIKAKQREERSRLK